MSTWQSLTTLPSNCDESIITQDPLDPAKSIYMVKKSGEVLKYSCDEDKWNEQNVVNQLPSLFEPSTANIDFINKKIYALGSQGSMAILEIGKNDSKWELIMENCWELDRFGSRGIIIKNQFHVINGFDSSDNLNLSAHIMYNEETKSANILYVFDYQFGEHQIVKIKNKLLLFGGASEYTFFDHIYEYDINENKWEFLRVAMPVKLSGSGCVAVLNGQYVLFLRGRREEIWCDDIWIFCVSDRSFRKSKVVCPDEDKYHGAAISICDRDNDKCITFGFVRDCWRKLGMDNNHRFPPEYLIRIMLQYYWNEYIHLFYLFDGDHWKMDVFDIIS